MKPNRSRVSDEEYRFTQGVLLSETDSQGIITYVNRRFCQVSGYDREELLGKNHNIVRHPDMPLEIFRELWETIREGRSWEGLIKNLRKDGRYYWVHTHIDPLRNIEKDEEGYVAVHRPADPEEAREAELRYKTLLIQEKART